MYQMKNGLGGPDDAALSELMDDGERLDNDDGSKLLCVSLCITYSFKN